MNRKPLRILYLGTDVTTRTGVETYRDLLVNEMQKWHEVTIADGKKNLSGEWDIAHIIDIKYFNARILDTLPCPVLIDVHDYYWMHPHHFFSLDFPLRKFFQIVRSQKYTKILKKADGVIVHSMYVKEKLGLKNTFVVDHGIEDLPYSDDQENPTKDDVILFVGRDYFRKGIHILFRALPFILDAVPTARVIIIGKEFLHSKFFAKLLCRNMPVTFHDGLPRKQVLSYYGKAKVFVLPSIMEAFGIVNLEALAAGVPVVASNVGGIPEAIRHEETGFLFNSGDHIKLAQYVIHCLKNRETSRRIVENGRHMLEHRFTLKEMIRQVEEIYKKFVYNEDEPSGPVESS